MITALMFGFLAGFSERAVPDLLAKTTLSAIESGKVDPALTQAKAAAAVADLKSSERLAEPFDDEDDSIAPPSEEDGMDFCLCDMAPIPGLAMTSDAELPVASGGVSADVPAGPIPTCRASAAKDPVP